MATQNQDRLRTHFAALDPLKHSAGWDSLWAEGTFIPWDRGYANPALIDFLASPSSPPTSSDPNPTPGAPRPDTVDGSGVQLPAKKGKVLVPGCGKGYDVVLLASYGYDVYGLEVSEHAAELANIYLSDPGKGPLEGEYAVKDANAGNGVMKCLLGDFFDNAWLKETGGKTFDLIYDNTFLCALPPSLRPKWAERMVELLSPDGILVCLEFPTHKPAKSGGPPWSLPPTVHQELLRRPGDDIIYNDDGTVVATDREESESALIRVAHWTPKRTHNIAVINGVVRDCVSVWCHKKHV
ncbi:S-adenosyl-L-methionine-dependent methyltransferase [Phaeosphaeria sp. MPI-PUGE-AT-0046c]|nr:S-adenosyl-L-methionine-dependent methyltransferase [Phaeosphaeria sp. MPI-PUGE-AT-0046c]